jgi:hypothetical protein
MPVLAFFIRGFTTLAAMWVKEFAEDGWIRKVHLV